MENAGSATHTVGNSGNSVSGALTGFVNAYNAVLSELNKSHGQNAGPLSGDSIISSVTEAFRQILNYSAGGSGYVEALTNPRRQVPPKGPPTCHPTKPDR